ncbi:hypothetical protein [uncultured Sphingomonas sp.]|uniref:hypothetical protein n=1 Tax=uncultured Sphingomonas sp. TaxID=158754 RepID=UPI0025DB16E6|nr:hypothetical protein [uncultured Sphingomonas sp.]
MKLLHLVLSTAMIATSAMGTCVSAAPPRQTFQLEGQLWRVEHTDKRLPSTVFYFMKNGVLTVYIKGMGVGAKYRLSDNRLCIAQRESTRCFLIKDKSETKMKLIGETGRIMFLTRKGT